MIPPAANIRPAWVTMSASRIQDTPNWMMAHVKQMPIQPKKKDDLSQDEADLGVRTARMR